MKAAILAALSSLVCGQAIAQTTGNGCNVTESFRSEMLGKTLTPALADSIMYASNAKMHRILKPGRASTPDLRTSRVNIYVNQEDKIVNVQCDVIDGK